MVTMRDIAKRANVSQTTVSFVLNKRQSLLISEETKARVFEAAKELGYRPNQMARALAKGRTDIVGVWLKALHSSYYMQLVHLFDRQITTSDYTMVFSRNATIHDTSSIMQTFPGMSVDGLIAIDIPETVDYFATHAFGGTPIVSFGSHFTAHVDCVALDMSAAVRDALNHLYDRGRRKIALMIDEGSHSVGGGPRLQEYLKFVADNSLSANIIVIKHQTFESARNSVIDNWTSAAQPPFDALLCYNDDLAVASIRAMNELGVSVPGQVSIVGCDDIAQASVLTPSLSTISHPHAEMSRVAWEFLHARMLDSSLPIQYQPFESKFIARESS